MTDEPRRGAGPRQAEASGVLECWIFVNKLFSSLELWEDGAVRTAAGQMACDEALARRVGQPVLRVYRWPQPAATFGYSQRIGELPESVRCLKPVRRWSGGGVVFHGRDLTLALVFSDGEVAAGKKSQDIYRSIHEGILSTVRRMVPGARLVLPDECRSGGVCFESPVEYDIVSCGEKICGGALRRFRGGVLYQGSLHCQGVGGGELAEGLAQGVEFFEGGGAVNEMAAVLEFEKYGTQSWQNLR